MLLYYLCEPWIFKSFASPNQKRKGPEQHINKRPFLSQQKFISFRNARPISLSSCPSAASADDDDGPS